MSFYKLAALAAAACIAGSPAAAETIKIGMVADYTGGFASNGISMQRGVQAYQAVNGKSVKGADGKTYDIEFVYRDSASGGADKAKQLAEELVVRERVKMLTGFFLSPHANAVADVITQAKIPAILMSAGSANLAASPYYVRVSLTVPSFTWCAGDYAGRAGLKKVYTLVADYVLGYDSEKYFKSGFTAHGGTIVGSARAPLQEMNYAVYMEKVLQAKPDALFISLATGAPSMAMLKAYVERGLGKAGIKLIGGGETQQVLIANMQDDITGVITALNYTETNGNKANVLLKQQLTKMFGATAVPDIYSVHAWDATDLIYKSVAALGAAADGDKYVDYMKKATFNSPRGPVALDPATRDVVQNIYVRKVERRDGKLVNIDVDKCDMVNTSKLPL